MKKVLILGRGPSINSLSNTNLEDVKELILINNHDSTVLDPKLFEKIKQKDIYLMCNIQQSGFTSTTMNKLDIKSCIINRLFPNPELWQEHKTKQKKNDEGGTLNNLGYLPNISEDEPYLYTWRGPAGKNKENMSTYGGRKIEHMLEEAEEYLIPVYKEKLICNCAFYASLYAVLKLKADHLIYYGVDFYNHKQILKKWFHSPPSYLTPEWWDLRIKYEGEHMKVLWDKHLTKMFPNTLYEFNTTEDYKPDNKNIIVNLLK